MNIQLLSQIPTSYSWWRVHYRNGSLGDSAVHFAVILGELATRLDRTLAKKTVPNNWTVEDALDTFGKVLEEKGVYLTFDQQEKEGCEILVKTELEVVRYGYVVGDLQVFAQLRKHNRTLAKLLMTAISLLPGMSISALWWMEEHLLEELAEIQGEAEGIEKSDSPEAVECREKIAEIEAGIEAVKQNIRLEKWGERLTKESRCGVGYMEKAWFERVKHDLEKVKIKNPADQLWVEWITAVLEQFPAQKRIFKGKGKAILENSIYSDEGVTFDQILGFLVHDPFLIGRYEQWLDDEYNNCGEADTVGCDAEKEQDDVPLLLEIKSYLKNFRALIERFEEIRMTWTLLNFGGAI